MKNKFFGIELIKRMFLNIFLPIIGFLIGSFSIVCLIEILNKIYRMI